MVFPELQTDRLQLVQIEEKHTDSYFEIMSKDEVTKYYGMESLKNLEDASKIIDSFERTYKSNRGIRWGIVLKETGEFIGTAGLNNLSVPGKRPRLVMNCTHCIGIKD